MKKLFSLLLALALLCLAGCSASPYASLGEEYNEGTDDQYWYACDLSNLSMAESPTHYYFITYNRQINNGVLCSKDKTTGEIAVVCSRPDGLHAAETDSERYKKCNATIDGNYPDSIMYSEGWIYALGDTFDGITKSYGLYRISPEGSGYENVVNLESMPLAVRMHRGYLYASFADSSTPLNEEKLSESRGYSIMRYSLKGEAKAEKVLGEEGLYGEIGFFYARSGTLYSALIYADSFNEKGNINITSKLLVTDLATLETRTAPMNSNDMRLDASGNIHTNAHKGDAFYAALMDTQGKIRHCFEDVPFSEVHLDAQYFYVDNRNSTYAEFAGEGAAEKREIRVYDRQYNLLNSFEMPRALPVIGSNGEYFFYADFLDESMSAYAIKAIKVSDIATKGVKGEWVHGRGQAIGGTHETGT